MRMKRTLLYIYTGLAALLATVNLSAQSIDRLPQARLAYRYFVSAQGDSLRAMMDGKMQAAISTEMLGGTYKQLEMQFGALQAVGEWQQAEEDGHILCYRDLQFEKMSLRFQMAFDGEGRIAGLFVRPAPAPVKKAAPVASTSAKWVERDTAVTCGTFQLPATLTLPREAVEKGRRVPCLVLVHGSGPQDRDETIGPNKPFRDLAWGLAERGIATLRYDKRTYVYKGNYVPEGRQLDLDVETTDDAVAAVALAQSLPQLSADSVYVLGHSQGGWLAPRIARRTPGLAGIILLAAPARPLEDLLLEQVAYLDSLAPSEQGRRQVADLRRWVKNVKQLGTPAFCDTIPLPFPAPLSYWADIRAYRAVDDAARLTLPILVVQAGRDYQVTMQDYDLWRQGLQGKEHVSFKVYPRLNHLMQEGTGKATPSEYYRPSSVPTYVLDDLACFIHHP